jgi:hypothetical protein
MVAAGLVVIGGALVAKFVIPFVALDAVAVLGTRPSCCGTQAWSSRFPGLAPSYANPRTGTRPGEPFATACPGYGVAYLTLG